LALKTDNTLWHWGQDYPGTIPTTASYTPRQIGTDEWKDFSANWTRSVGIKMDGTLWIWGGGYWCEGKGTLVNGSYDPIQIESDDDWESLGTTRFTTYAIKEDFTLWKWGYEDCEQ